MSKKIRIGICGYGNLGKGAETEISANPDMELAAVFTRRNPAGSLKTKTDVPVVHVDSAGEWTGRIDVMLLCGGSSSDLPKQGPRFAKEFNTVDSFDTHAKIPEHLAAMDKAARSGGNVSVISVGWDPGLFSLMRLYMGSIIPKGDTYTFWGKGVSQGHSEAVRRIKGVENAIQYSIPVETALEKVRAFKKPKLTARDKTARVCYVVAEDGADKAHIESEIKNMPNYFDEYDTTVHFITAKELKAEHSALPHGGNVLHTGITGKKNKQMLEFSLKLDSNPEFTASVMLAYARAAYRLSQKNEVGARTIFDIPPALLFYGNINEAVSDLL